MGPSNVICVEYNRGRPCTSQDDNSPWPKILVLRMTYVEELLLLSADAEGSVELSARNESGVPHIQREKNRSNI